MKIRGIRNRFVLASLVAFGLVEFSWAIGGPAFYSGGDASTTREFENIYGVLTKGDIPSSAVAGTTTNDNAIAGRPGEVISGSVLRSAAASLTTGTFLTITSLPLTPGHWKIHGMAGFLSGGSTVITNETVGFSLTNNTRSGIDTEAVPNTSGEVYLNLATPSNTVSSGNSTDGISIPDVTVKLAAATTLYLVSEADFSVSTLKTYGSIEATRVR